MPVAIAYGDTKEATKATGGSIVAGDGVSQSDARVSQVRNQSDGHGMSEKLDPKQADGPEQTEKRLALRARAREGVGECVRRMTTQVWRTGKSHNEVAAMYGVAYDTVVGWASTASQIIHHAIGNGDEVRARLLAGLEHVHELALTGDEVDLRAAVSAIAEQAKLLNLLTTKVEQTVSIASDPQWVMLMTTISDALEPYPEAKQAVIERVRAHNALPVRA